MRKPLTIKQEKVYNSIVRLLETNGYSPNFREIGLESGLSSVATVSVHLNTLQNKGYITFDKNKSRTIRLVEEMELENETIK